MFVSFHCPAKGWGPVNTTRYQRAGRLTYGQSAQSLNRLTDVTEQVKSESSRDTARRGSRQTRRNTESHKTCKTVQQWLRLRAVSLISWSRTGDWVGGARWNWRENRTMKLGGAAWVSDRERARWRQVCIPVWVRWQRERTDWRKDRKQVRNEHWAEL